MSFRWLRILTSIFFGMLIGGALALDFRSTWWWLGVVIGGGVGGSLSLLMCVFPHLPKAWRTTRWQLRNLGHPAPAFLSRVRHRALQFPFIVLGLIDCALWVLVIATVSARMSEAPIAVQLATLFPIVTLACVVIMGLAVISLTSIWCFFSASDEHWRDDSWLVRGVAIGGIPPVTALALFAAVFIWVYEERAKIIASFVAAKKALWMFVRLLFVNSFRFVHKHEVVLCALWSAVGSFVVYLNGGYSVVGLVLGAAAGVLYFELVSVRLLKLAPRVARKP